MALTPQQIQQIQQANALDPRSLTPAQQSQLAQANALMNSQLQDTQNSIDTTFLPAYERSYYNIPGYMAAQFGTGNADQKSATNAASRGGQYYQQNRINQIRAKTGNTEAFDPILSKNQSDDTAEQDRLARDAAVSKGMSVQEALQKWPIRNGTAGTSIVNIPQATGSSNLMSDAERKRQIDSVPGVLQPYYQNAAVKAGTLTSSDQSQHALNSDIQAGAQGAVATINHNNDILNTANSSNLQSNPDLFPQRNTSGTPMTAAQAPASVNKPEDAPASTTTLSGQSTAAASNAARMKQIQNRRIGS